jgi:AraC-like DNA-binding protein
MACRTETQRFTGGTLEKDIDSVPQRPVDDYVPIADGPKGRGVTQLGNHVLKITPSKQTGPTAAPHVTTGVKRENISENSIRIIATPTPTAINTFFYVQRIGYYETVPPYSRNAPGLDAYNVFFTVSGSGYFEYEGKRYTQRRGDIVWFDCRKRYSVGAEPGGWNYYWLQFNGNSARGFYKEYTKRGDNFTKVGTEFSTYRALFDRIIDLTQSTSIRHEILINDALVHMMTILLENRVDSSLTLNSVPEYIRSAVEYLNWHYAEKISLDEIAEHVNVSKFHLSRSFKRYVGVTIGDYILANRLRYARELLKYTDVPIRQVAEMCGIPQPSHFTAVFKQAEGITPLNYRKHWEETGYYEAEEPRP